MPVSPLARLTVSAALTLTCVVVRDAGAQSRPESAVRFRHFSADDGLPSSLVSDIVQDRRGLMWLATGHGVARFDGRHFDLFNAAPGLPGALPRELVDQLTLDPDGRIWAVTEGGIARFRADRDAFEVVAVQGLPGADSTGAPVVTTQLLFAPNGDGWLGTSVGLYELRSAGAVARRVRLPIESTDHAAHITALRWGAHGELWIGTRRGMARLARIPGRTEADVTVPIAESELPDPWVRSFAIDGQGRLWVATQNGVLVTGQGGTRRFSVGQGARVDAQLDAAHLSAARVARLWADQSGRGVWAGTENGGLDFIDSRDWRVSHYRHESNDPSSLRSNSIWSIAQDDRGVLWVGTFSGGVSMTLPTGGAIRGYASVGADASSLSYDVVPAFGQAADGTLWIATDGGGVNRFDAQTGRFDRFSRESAGLPVNAILSIAPDRHGTIWMGTWNGGVVGFNPTTRRVQLLDRKRAGLSNDNVYEVLLDRHEQLWAGTDDGRIVQLDPSRSRVVREFDVNPPDALPSSVLSLREMSDGRFAAALREGGAVVLDPRTGTQIHLHVGRDSAGLSSNAARAVLPQGDSVLWVAGENGLDRVDLRTWRRSNIGVAQGLPSRFVMAVVEGDSGDLWITTDRGLTRYSTRTRTARTFTRDDGLTANEFIMRSAFRAHDGRLYFGGNHGFSQVDPRRLPPGRTRTRVLFTHLSLFDKRVVPGVAGSPLPLWLPDVDTVHLGHDQTMVAVEFSALNLGASDRVRYAYRLPGVTDRWTDLGSRDVVSVANLQPGSYGLEVRAAGVDESWSTPPSRLTLIIAAPWWGTWWFRLLAALLSAVLGWRIWLFERRRKIQQMLAKQAVRDTLTGLSNRMRFERTLARAIDRAKRTAVATGESRLALLFLDLDNFKVVNDTQGHHAGDELLRAVAARLLDATRGSDTVARFGGDEFAVLLDDLHDEQAALVVADRITNTLSRPILLELPTGAYEAHIGVSLGITYGDGTQSVAVLMQQADTAMYEAKHGGKGRRAIFVSTSEPAGEREHTELPERELQTT